MFWAAVLGVFSKGPDFSLPVVVVDALIGDMVHSMYIPSGFQRGLRRTMVSTVIGDSVHRCLEIIRLVFKLLSDGSLL
jgi:hypothetical protein